MIQHPRDVKTEDNAKWVKGTCKADLFHLVNPRSNTGGRTICGILLGPNQNPRPCPQIDSAMACAKCVRRLRRNGFRLQNNHRVYSFAAKELTHVTH